MEYYEYLSIIAFVLSIISIILVYILKPNNDNSVIIENYVLKTNNIESTGGIVSLGKVTSGGKLIKLMMKGNISTTAIQKDFIIGLKRSDGTVYNCQMGIHLDNDPNIEFVSTFTPNANPNMDLLLNIGDEIILTSVNNSDFSVSDFATLCVLSNDNFNY